MRAALLLALFSTAALADSPKTMDAVDFLVDRDNLVGQEVTVTGCRIVGANVDNVPCKTGMSIFYIDSPTMDRESLRRALKRCASYEDLKECDADVTGAVNKVNFRWGLSRAKLAWKIEVAK